MNILSESSVIWLISFAVVALIVATYVRSFRRRVAADHARKREAAEMGLDRPVAQFPFIDPEHCIGCGACVRACPEGDVLGIVGGTAVIVNGLRCVGHGRCEDACPVGAITVGVGDLRSREDVPLLDHRFETTVPGVFVVGELGGLSLVRNAVEQGRRVIESIRPGDDQALDVIVVGAGPAGLSAGLAAQAAGLRCLVLEKEPNLGGSLLHYPRRKMVLTQPVSLDPWGSLRKEEYTKEALLEFFEALIEKSRLSVQYGERIERIQRVDNLLEIKSDQNLYRARNVVLALGRRGSPRKLGVAGEERSNVMYRLIDAESYRGQKILVVGGGDSAVEAAIGLVRAGNEVTLSYRRERLVRIKKKNEDAFNPLLRAGKIKTLFNSQPVEIREGRVVLTIDGETVEIENDWVFIFAGGVPPFDFLRKSGIGMGGSTASASA